MFGGSLQACLLTVLRAECLQEADDAKNRFTHLDGDHLTLLNVFHARLGCLDPETGKPLGLDWGFGDGLGHGLGMLGELQQVGGLERWELDSDLNPWFNCRGEWGNHPGPSKPLI